MNYVFTKINPTWIYMQLGGRTPMEMDVSLENKHFLCRFNMWDYSSTSWRIWSTLKTIKVKWEYKSRFIPFSKIVLPHF